MAITVNAFTTKSGTIAVFLVSDDALGGIAATTAVVSNPTIKVNGVTRPTIGPYPLGTGSECWVAYDIRPAVSPSDVLTYSASAGWVACAGGNAPAATNAPVTNNRCVVPVDMRLPANPTMRIGSNFSMPTLNVNSIWSEQKDIAHKVTANGNTGHWGTALAPTASI